MDNFRGKLDLCENVWKYYGMFYDFLPLWNDGPLRFLDLTKKSFKARALGWDIFLEIKIHALNVFIFLS